jgi:glucosamine-6-phosphate deaminase
MKIIIRNDPVELGKSAGNAAASIINEAVKANGQANIILATGASQFETLKDLITQDIDWSKVVMFHLDEYIGLPESHPASFRKYLKERFLNKVSPLRAFYLINGEADAAAECRRLSNIIRKHPIDVALVGIGENGHLAFNDPPANFETTKPYILVELDRDCRNQQMNEGWFKTIHEVPEKAISMSIKQLLKSKYIICSVPDKRKAKAVKDCLEQPVSNLYPASILQQHNYCTYFLDKASASLLIAHEV